MGLRQYNIKAAGVVVEEADYRLPHGNKKKGDGRRRERLRREYILIGTLQITYFVQLAPSSDITFNYELSNGSNQEVSTQPIQS